MRSISTFSFFLFISALLPSLSSAKNHEDVSFISKRKTTRDLNTCKSIASKVSKSSSVFFEGSPEYVQYLTHYMSSSSQNSTCVFLPTDPKDISIAVSPAFHYFIEAWAAVDISPSPSPFRSRSSVRIRVLSQFLQDLTPQTQSNHRPKGFISL